MEKNMGAVDHIVLKCELDVRISNEDIDDIMVSALEGGSLTGVKKQRSREAILESMQATRSVEVENWFCMMQKKTRHMPSIKKSSSMG